MGIFLFLWLAASIEGRLTNALTGGPVRKADVAVGTVEGIVVQRVLSDVNGHFVVSGLGAGRYRVAAARAGYLPALSQAVIAVKGDERREVNLAMDTPAVIAGHVMDEESDPVEGVPVTALSRDALSGTIHSVGTTKTNDMGEYRFAGLTAGAYVLRTGRAAAPLGEVYQPAFYPNSGDWDGAQPVRVAAGGEAREIDISVRKQKGGSIAGVVHGEGAEPVWVRVSRRAADAVMLALPEGALALPPGGHFLFPNLTPGVYVVAADTKRRSGELLWASAEIAVNGAEAQAELTLRPARMLPIEANEPVRAVLTRGDRFRLEAQLQEGRLAFANVIPGTWFLQVEPVAPDRFVESVRVGERETLGKPFELGADAWSVLRVRVTAGPAVKRDYKP